MAACVVLTTFGDMKSAERMARSVVSAKLAACATAVPGAVSHYRWKNKVQRAREVLLLVKTSRSLWPRLLTHIKKNHPYDVPEILAVPVSKGSREYLSWLKKSLKK